MDKKEVLESRGVHQFQRIGRPDVWYDCRTTYHTDVKSFEQAINERKSIITVDEDENIFTPVEEMV